MPERSISDLQYVTVLERKMVFANDTVGVRKWTSQYKSFLKVYTVHSVFSDFTGFATAIFIARKPTVIGVMSNAERAGIKNIDQLIEMQYTNEIL